MTAKGIAVNLSRLSVSELRLELRPLMAQVQQSGKSDEPEESGDLAQAHAHAAILAIAHAAGMSLTDLLATAPADPRQSTP